MTETDFPRIDYRQHPAFARLPECAWGDDLEPMLDRIDDALAAAEEESTGQAASRLFTAEVSPVFERLIAACREAMPPRFARERAMKALEASRTVLLDQTKYRVGQRGYTADAEGRRSERVTRDLRERGVAVAGVDRATVDRVTEAIRPAFEDLRGQTARDPRDRRAHPLGTDLASFAALLGALDSEGILGAIRDYERCSVVPIYWALVHSVGAETWWRDCYRDVGLPTARTAYMHNDEDFAIVKAIIYLGDVGPRSGPFSFIPGSPAWRRSRVRSRLAKQVDRAFIDTLTTNPNPGGSRYYRPHFFRPDMRREFLALPRPFRASSHFGDDVLDDSELSRDLLAREERLTGERGTCVIFCGRDGIHRGGLVEEGERWALQLGFARPDQLPRPPVTKQLRRAVVRGVRTVLGDRAVDVIKSALRGE